MNTKSVNGTMRVTTILGLCVLLFAGCNNFFNNLVPPDETRILSFEVPGQIGRAVIFGDTVRVTVAKGTELKLIPTLTVSPKASCIPLTMAYLSRTFPGIDLLQEATAIYQTRDLTAYVTDLIKKTPDFTVPALNEPIDFSGPVQFLVIGGQGSIRQHTIYVTEDSDEPVLLGFSFAKYDNPELIRDAPARIYEADKTALINVLYPMEMVLSYSLIPSFEILGEKLEVDGVELRSGIDPIQFAKTLGTQTKTITVTRNGETAEYTLSVNFTEDPDSIRSIIDFRFYKTGNAGIAATAVGSIVNNNTFGTINVQVFYSGTRPSTLTPSFLSPGNVSVAGVAQISGSSSQDFSQTLEYRVVSRNNLYVRTYTVRVDFIDVSAASPRMTSFRFSSGLNPELVQDTDASISESAGLILITARYGGSFAPDPLVPEFQATGLVSVRGAVQISGFSSQDFSIQVKYTVTDPVNSLLSRDYWVQVSFTRDTSSDAKINSFSFHPDENPGLADEITGRIDQNSGTITLFAPIGSGVTARIMFPRFRAAGQVEADGIVQTSGGTGRLFDAPVEYTAVSANGTNRKTYTVTVRELQTTIFVSRNAAGMGDGTSWADAFRELSAACEAAAEFPADVLKEIWIAEGTYKPSTNSNREDYFLLAPTTSYIGGFAGHETAKSQRNVAANKVIISGDLGGGVYSNNLFGSFNGNNAAVVNGDVFFYDMEFTGARTAGSGGRANGGAVNAALAAGFEMSISNCAFTDLRANNGSIVYINGGKLLISGNEENNLLQGSAVYGVNLDGVEIDGIKLHTVTNYGLYFANCSGDSKINGVDLQTVTGAGFYFSNCPGNIEINSVNLRDISGNGIYITGGGGRRNLSRITGNNIDGAYGVYVSGGSGVTLADSGFDKGGIYVDSSSSAIRLTNTEIKNVSGSNGVYANGRSIVVENVKVENVPNGRGMNIVSTGIAQILDSTIKNVNSGSDNGGGIYLDSPGGSTISGCTIKNAKTTGSGGGICIASGSTEISGTTIEDIEADYGGGIYTASAVTQVNISNTVIRNAIAENCGGGIFIFGLGSAVISGTTIENVEANYAGGGIYADTGYFEITGSSIKNAKTKFILYGGLITGETVIY